MPAASLGDGRGPRQPLEGLRSRAGRHQAARWHRQLRPRDWAVPARGRWPETGRESAAGGATGLPRRGRRSGTWTRKTFATPAHLAHRSRAKTSHRTGSGIRYAGCTSHGPGSRRSSRRCARPHRRVRPATRCSPRCSHHGSDWPEFAHPLRSSPHRRGRSRVGASRGTAKPWSSSPPRLRRSSRRASQTKLFRCWRQQARMCHSNVSPSALPAAGSVEHLRSFPSAE